MKTRIYFSLLLLSIMCGGFSSCRLFGHDEPDIISYDLAFSFQDEAGNDLVRGIELNPGSPHSEHPSTDEGWVKSDLYILNIIASRPCEDLLAGRPFVPDAPKLYMRPTGDYCFLTNNYGFLADECPNEKVITYKLRCPYVFGDYNAHEFVTWWSIPEISDSDYTRAECYRIEFDGKSFTPEKTIDNYQIIITLEDRE